MVRVEGMEVSGKGGADGGEWYGGGDGGEW